MRRLIHLVLLSSLLMSLIACAGESPTTTPNQPSQQTIGGGGNLILTLGDDPDTLDPAMVADTTSSFMTRQLFSGLMTLSNELTPEFDLAESLDISEDERVYTFKLRENVRFADGTPITADDLRWSLERATDPAMNPMVAATYLNDIEGSMERISGGAETLSGVKVIDDRTIEITLYQPSSVFLAKISNPPAFVIDRRAVERGGDWFEQPNGSGPFMIDSWERRQNLQLVPNPNVIGEPAKLDRITFLIGAAGSNPLGLYEEGEIDFAGVGSYSLDRIASVTDPLHDELHETPQMSLSYIAFNTKLAPFDDPKVREAFSLLIDRAKLAEVSFNGTVTAARGVLPPEMPGADPSQLPEPTADIERAKQLLAESSYGSAANLPPIVGLAGSGNVGFLAELARAELGITIEMRAFDEFGSYLNSLATDEYNIYDMNWIADYPDPQNFLDVLFGPQGPYNFTGYADDEYNRLLAEALAETDASKRGELYRQAERRLMEAFVVLPLYHDTDFTLVKPYVEGLTVTGLGLNDLTGVSLRRK